MKASPLKWIVFAAALVLCLVPAVYMTSRPGKQLVNSADTAGVSTDAAAGQDASESPALAAFTAETLDGGTYTQDDLAAKDVTVMNFWSLTCGPCIQEMPELAAFAKALPDNVQVVTVCLDGLSDKASAGNILQEAGFEGVTLLSADGDLLALCSEIMYTPTTVFIDSAGKLSGEPIVGKRPELAADYLAAVNAALEAQGKEAVSLAEA